MRPSMLLLLALCVNILGGCSMTVPFQGTAEDGSETFTGTTTGYADGSGVVNIVSNKGLVCTGKFVYVTERTGSGTFTCRDGTSGTANFVSAGRHGTGSGRLGNRRFTFTFG